MSVIFMSVNFMSVIFSQPVGLSRLVQINFKSYYFSTNSTWSQLS